MSARLYTAHLRRGADPASVALIEDRWRWGAAAWPTLWALWRGSWLLALALIAFAAAQGALAADGQPEAALAAGLALRLILGFEGGAAARLDLRLRGWRIAGAVEAADEAGAERVWFAGAPA